jgi:hypothetical protein
LLRRLRRLVRVLHSSDDPDRVVEVDSPEWPGLSDLAQTIVQRRYLHHADADVRLYTVRACIELLTIVRCNDLVFENTQLFTKALLTNVASLSSQSIETARAGYSVG